MKTVVRLFIGGEWDGKRVSVPIDQFFWRVKVLEEPPPAVTRITPHTGVDWSIQEYGLRAINMGAASVYVFVLLGMTEQEVFDKLIGSYQPRPEDTDEFFAYSAAEAFPPGIQ